MKRPSQCANCLKLKPKLQSEISMPDPTNTATLLASLAQREISKAYRGAPPKWRTFARGADPTIGRKRRARRARGRKIATRRTYSAAPLPSPAVLIVLRNAACRLRKVADFARQVENILRV